MNRLDDLLDEWLDWLPSPSQHLLVVTFALLVYILSTRARREQRAPTTAIAWVMGYHTVVVLKNRFFGANLPTDTVRPTWNGSFVIAWATFRSALYSARKKRTSASAE